MVPAVPPSLPAFAEAEFRQEDLQPNRGPARKPCQVRHTRWVGLGPHQRPGAVRAGRQAGRRRVETYIPVCASRISLITAPAISSACMLSGNAADNEREPSHRWLPFLPHTNVSDPGTGDAEAYGHRIRWGAVPVILPAKPRCGSRQVVAMQQQCRGSRNTGGAVHALGPGSGRPLRLIPLSNKIRGSIDQYPCGGDVHGGRAATANCPITPSARCDSGRH